MGWQLTEVSGVCLVPGHGSGRVRFLDGTGGDDSGVLVASSIEPADVPEIFDCTALVLESADLTSHAAITARELGVPTLASASGALETLRAGDLVFVDTERRRVLRSGPDDDACALCESSPAVEVHRGTSLRAIEDMFPIRPGHVLIVPRRHVVDLADLTAADWVELGETVGHLRALWGNPDLNLAMNSGTAAGQTIAHLHWHLVPRTAGDDPDPRGGVRRIVQRPFRPYPAHR